MTETNHSGRSCQFNHCSRVQVQLLIDVTWSWRIVHKPSFHLSSSKVWEDLMEVIPALYFSRAVQKSMLGQTCVCMGCNWYIGSTEHIVTCPLLCELNSCSPSNLSSSVSLFFLFSSLFCLSTSAAKSCQGFQGAVTLTISKSLPKSHLIQHEDAEYYIIKSARRQP